MSSVCLEQLVFSKPYFDRFGLIVAEDDLQPVGFVHAGFGPTEDHSAISTDAGVTSMLMVRPHEQREQIARELLAQSEEYLRRRGALVIYGGGIFPLNPFYLGLYGGSELPGVLASDKQLCDLFQTSGYREIDRCIVLQRDLADFRPLVDRRQLQIRRDYLVESVFEPEAADWWEACTSAPTGYTRFELRARSGGTACGRVTLWEMEPLASSWGVPAVGLIQLHVEEPFRRQGLAAFLCGEALKRSATQGIARVEVQAMQLNTAALSLYTKLGFREVDQGCVYRREP